MEDNGNRKKDKTYYTNKEMKAMYPKGGFRIVGEKLDTSEVQPLKSYRKGVYKRVGYQWSQESDGFIVVKKNNVGWLIVYGVVAISMIVGVVFGVNHLLSRTSIDPNSAPFTSTTKRPDEMDETRILVPGYNDWNMLEGAKEIAVALYNPDENPCYFQFNIILDETGEVLFKTGLVPPGEAVTTVKLPRVFEVGEYPITVNIHTFALEDATQKLNGGEVKTSIVVFGE